MMPSDYTLARIHDQRFREAEAAAAARRQAREVADQSRTRKPAARTGQRMLTYARSVFASVTPGLSSR